MIKYSLIVAVILLLLHGAYVHHAPMLSPTAQNQWQHNLIGAQRFVYGEDGNPKNILLGSSLTGRIMTSELPDTINLSFAGLSLFDGLNVLLQSRQRPKFVYIEMNLVLREEDGGFKSSLNNPILDRLRQWFPSMRDENQPVSLLVQFMRKCGITRSAESSQAAVRPQSRTAPNNTPVINDELFAQLLALKVEEYSKVPEQVLLEKRIGVLKNDVKELEKQGVTVVFFEMPVNSRLYNSPLMKAVDEKFYEIFPPNIYTYIPKPPEDYITTDAVHLGPEEAARYTDYFKSHMVGGVTRGGRK